MEKMSDRKIVAIKKKLSKVKVGLPKKVLFQYEQGIVICEPKLRKWVIKPYGKNEVVHIIQADRRVDVTKHKAKHLLKMAIINLLRNDKS